MVRHPARQAEGPPHEADADTSASSRIFISYRREDTEGHVLALIPPLRERFGDRIFKDTDNIAPGQDFTKVINRELQSCAVLLAVIGKDWVTAEDQKGHRRLDSPNDYLRLEVATALKNEHVTVIPVLVGRASVPSPEDLPPDLQALTVRNAIELSAGRWPDDVERLSRAIAQVCGESPATVNERSQRQPAPAATPPAPLQPAYAPDGDFDQLEVRRRRQVAEHLKTARQAFEALDYQAVLEVCERVVWLNPQDADARRLAHQARTALDDQKIHDWLARARDALGHPQLTDADLRTASELVDQALSLNPAHGAAVGLRLDVLALRKRRERQREVDQQLQAALAKARASFDEEDYDTAIERCDDALTVCGESADALDLRSAAVVAKDEQRRRRELKRRAQQAVHDARAPLLSDAETAPARDDERDRLAALATHPTAATSPPAGVSLETIGHARPEPSETIDAPLPPTPADVPFDTARNKPEAVEWLLQTSLEPGRPTAPGSLRLQRSALAAGTVLVILLIVLGGINRRHKSNDPPSEPARAPAPASEPASEPALSTVVDSPAAGDPSGPKPAGSDPSVPPPSDVSALPAPTPAAGPLRAAARRAWAAGDREGAMATLARALTIQPGDREATRLIDSFIRESADRTAKAAQDASRLDVPMATGSPFSQARGRQQAAAAHRQQGDWVEAVRAYDEAIELFAAVMKSPAVKTPPQPRSEASPPALPAASPAAGHVETITTAPPAAMSTPPIDAPVAGAGEPRTTAAAPPPAREPHPAAPAIVDDDALIRQVLRRYQDGYTNLDAAAVHAVYPGIDVRSLADAFKEYVSLNQQLDIERIQLSPDRQEASVTGTITDRPVTRIGKAANRRRSVTFKLRKAAGAWLIEAVQSR